MRLRKLVYRGLKKLNRKLRFTGVVIRVGGNIKLVDISRPFVLQPWPLSEGWLFWRLRPPYSTALLHLLRMARYWWLRLCPLCPIAKFECRFCVDQAGTLGVGPRSSSLSKARWGWQIQFADLCSASWRIRAYHGPEPFHSGDNPRGVGAFYFEWAEFDGTLSTWDPIPQNGVIQRQTLVNTIWAGT